MLKLEVGKKYLDSNGSVWVICDQPTPSFYAAELVGSTNLPSIVRQDGEFLFVLNNLVSEVPTTPTFKVGDRVRAVVNNCGFTGTVANSTSAMATVQEDGTGKSHVCYNYELTLLTDDTQPTYVPKCTCDIHAIMRNGCSCGHARVAIEQEFKREGWR